MANAPLFQREGDGGVNNGLDISSRHGTVPLAVASVLLRRRRLDSLLRIQKRKEKEMCVAFLTHHPTPWLQMFLSGSLTLARVPHSSDPRPRLELRH
jgi:hypothetical protein